MPNHQALRLAFSNPAIQNTISPIDRLKRAKPKRHLPIRTLTSKDLLQTQIKLEYLNRLMPGACALLAGMVDNLLAHYYLEHQTDVTADEPISAVGQDTVGTEYRAGHT
jgi:hypothetical protein